MIASFVSYFIMSLQESLKIMSGPKSSRAQTKYCVQTFIPRWIYNSYCSLRWHTLKWMCCGWVKIIYTILKKTALFGINWLQFMWCDQWIYLNVIILIIIKCANINRFLRIMYFILQGKILCKQICSFSLKMPVSTGEIYCKINIFKNTVLFTNQPSR
jgi:hypothetical protein